MNKRRGLYAAAAAALVVCAAVPALDSRLTVRRYAVQSEKLSVPVRLALLTDFHGCNYGRGQKELLSALAEAAPDLVLLGGDIFDDHGDGAHTLELIPLLAERWPCYYVTGNHEWWTMRAEEVKAWMERQGVTVLAGDCVQVQAGGQSLSLCGIDDPRAGEQRWAAQLEQAAGARQEGFSLLLTHRPERIAAYLPCRFDLVLAGHAHGGQWRLPGLINGLYAPDQGLFPPYAGGLYHLKRTIFIVSRGLARETTRVPRIFNRPELVVVDLLP